MRLPKTTTSVEYTALTGGLDQVSPTLTVSPGKLIMGSNYIPASIGGYERIDGYERYDGQASPSDAEYYYGAVTITGSVSVGDTVTGATSGATGVICVVGSGYIDITKVSGTFEAESFTVGAVVQGAFTSVPGPLGEITSVLHATAMSAAADQYRSDIAAPTGSGAVRGLGILNGVLYCFRDNAAGTAGLIYKATSSGWTGIPLYSEISFNTGVESIPDGTTITQLVSGATATVKRTVWESGAWGSDAAGRLIISDITGTFTTIDEIQVAAATKVTATSIATDICISPGGRYEIIQSNFYGQSATRRLYGADGENRGFEFDGSVYVPLVTGMDTDKPEHVHAYKKQLFFSFAASSQNSGLGTPYKWTAVTGSLEIAMGDDITGYATLPGKALGIFSRNESSQLLGSTVDDFELDSISPEVGAIPYTIQTLGNTFCLDDRGVVAVSATDSYGNFEQSTISRLVQKAVDTIRGDIVASSVYRSKNQYRLYADDGTGLSMTITEDGVSFGQFIYPDKVACTVCGEDSTGKDVVFFGVDDGMVYQADKGRSFDGEDIEAYMMPMFNNSKSPMTRKTYRRATIEMSAEGYSSIRFSPYMSYADPNIAEHFQDNLEITGQGGFWDLGYWDEFNYDSEMVQNPTIPIEGTGTNISMLLYSKNNIDAGHKIDGIIIQYSPRRLSR